MSFIRADINIRTPTIPGMEIEQPVYFGSGDDSGVVVYDPDKLPLLLSLHLSIRIIFVIFDRYLLLFFHI